MLKHDQTHNSKMGLTHLGHISSLMIITHLSMKVLSLSLIKHHIRANVEDSKIKIKHIMALQCKLQPIF